MNTEVNKIKEAIEEFIDSIIIDLNFCDKNINEIIQGYLTNENYNLNKLVKISKEDTQEGWYEPEYTKDGQYLCGNEEQLKLMRYILKYIYFHPIQDLPFQMGEFYQKNYDYIDNITGGGVGHQALECGHFYGIDDMANKWLEKNPQYTKEQLLELYPDNEWTELEGRGYQSREDFMKYGNEAQQKFGIEVYDEIMYVILDVWKR